ncbi:hypothetical protein nbrc107697_23340 [Gordonia crocea]|uniref:Uncharacterized protein n=1 Tax=Gordonia crocea TaxID=589162 RepID=A0A7I9UYV3_9ACTN|nr:hypothetical protein nbrc107697_23340 [Gordonia crocea]
MNGTPVTCIVADAANSTQITVIANRDGSHASMRAKNTARAPRGCGGAALDVAGGVVMALYCACLAGD